MLKRCIIPYIVDLLNLFIHSAIARYLSCFIYFKNDTWLVLLSDFDALKTIVIYDNQML